jgi:transcriptional regulator with XRE-family HTH domain
MNRLKELRKNKRMSQSEIAKQFNITQAGYSLWESGKVTIDNESLQRLSKFFGVSVDHILYNEQDKIVTSKSENDLIKMFRELSETEKAKVYGYIQSLLDNQN